MRAKTGDLVLQSASPWCSVHTYRSEHRQDIVESENFFLPCRTNLRRADMIDVVFDHDGELNWARYMVTESGPQTVAIKHLMGATVESAAPVVDHSRDNSLKLKAEHKGFGRYDIIDEQGVTLVNVDGKDYANAIVEGREAIPEQSDIDRARRTAAQAKKAPEAA